MNREQSPPAQPEPAAAVDHPLHPGLLTLAARLDERIRTRRSGAFDALSAPNALLSNDIRVVAVTCSTTELESIDRSAHVAGLSRSEYIRSQLGLPGKTC